MLRISNLFWTVCAIHILASCEVDPDIVDEIKPIPVIYGVINKYDSVNYISITKTFSSDPYGAYVNAKNPDSIYFDNVTVSAELIKVIDGMHPGEHIIESTLVSMSKEIRHDKQEGNFSYPDYPIFILYQDLTDYQYVEFLIHIPGYDSIKCHKKLIEKPILFAPRANTNSFKVIPNEPFQSGWMGSGYSDVKYYFEIITIAGENEYHDTISYYWLGIESFNRVFTHSFKYEHLQSIINLQLPVYPKVNYRKFGNVMVEIATSGSFFYKTNSSEFDIVNNDYIGTSNYERPEYFGMIATMSVVKVDSIELNAISRNQVHQDTSLSKFKFIKW